MENQKQNITEKPEQPKSEPKKETNPKTPEVKNKLSLSLETSARLLVHVEELEKQYPNEFKMLSEKYPLFKKNIDNLNRIIASLNTRYDSIDETALRNGIEEYNALAKTQNWLMQKILEETEKKNEIKLIEIANGQIEFDAASLNPAEKTELRNMAKEMYEIIFPKSYIDKLVDFANGSYADMAHIPKIFQKNLPLWAVAKQDVQDWQKIGAAPMNGIEGAVRGVISLMDPETYTEGYENIKTTCSLSKKDYDAILNMINFTYRNTSSADKIAPTISTIVSFLLIFGAASKVKGALGSIKGMEKLSGIFGKSKIARAGGILGGLTLKGASSIGKYGPLTATLGIALPYISR